MPTIGDNLNAAGVSWAYYGGQWNQYLANPNANYVLPNNQYCNICNFFQYSTSIMKNPASRANLKDTLDLTTAIANNTLPAVSFVKPDGWLDGHPASSKLILFEGFVKKIVDEVQANPTVWNSTAIIVTFDEGGGYYDSGYIQPLDFFGDGTRIPAPRHLALHQGRPHLTQLRRPRFDPEIHRSQLGTAAHHRTQPRQLPQPRHQQHQPVRPVEHSRHQRLDGRVRLLGK